MVIDPTQIQLSPEQQSELAELSTVTGKPWPIVLHEALATYRHGEAISTNGNGNGESFYDAALRLGFVGCLKGGPEDLSTNPIYMEGFGESDD